MRAGRSHNKQMKDLMAGPHKIKRSRIPLLGDPGGIDGGAENVHCALGNDPAQTHALVEPDQAVDCSAVQDRDAPGEAKRDKHSRAEGTPLGGSEGGE